MKGVWWWLAAVFFRPLLTVAGFLFGISLMSMGIQMLNTLIIPTVKNNMDGGGVYMAFIGYLFVYLGCCYVICNFCAKMSEMVPAAAYRWMNANAGGERDEASVVGTAVGGVLGRIHASRGGGGSKG